MTTDIKEKIVEEIAEIKNNPLQPDPNASAGSVPLSSEEDERFKRYSAFDYASTYADYDKNNTATAVNNNETASATASEINSEAAPEAETASGDGGNGNTNGNDTKEAEEEKNTNRPMTLRDHFSELRFRLIRIFIALLVGFLACFYFSNPYLMEYIYLPLLRVLPDASKIIATGIPDPFLIAMKVAFAAGFFLTSPYIFYQIWAFISPGLYIEEKRFVVPVAIFSALCFLGGGAFCYFVVFPFAFEFFVNFTTVFVSMPSATQYFDFTLQLLVVFGLVFELPLFAFFLARMGIINATMLRKVRRYAILTSVIIAAILTPPDAISQLLMAGPMILLYEISIIVTVIFGKKKKIEAEADKENEEKETNA